MTDNILSISKFRLSRMQVVSVAVTLVLAGQPAAADVCLTDSNGDGTATTGVDDIGGALDTGPNATACGTLATASDSNTTALGLRTQATAANATATGAWAEATDIRSTATGAWAEATGSNSTATGTFSDALGSWSIAMGVFTTANRTGAIAIGSDANGTGTGALANGVGAIALGADAAATADQAIAIGQDASATFTNSTAIGTGVATTAANQVMIGSATNTYTLPGLTSAASAAAQTGPISLVTTDAGGNLASDGGALFSGLAANTHRTRQNEEGVAMAIALDAPYVPPSSTFAMNGGLGFFEGSSAFAISGAVRVNPNLQFDAGLGYGLRHDTVGGRVGMSMHW